MNVNLKLNYNSNMCDLFSEPSVQQCKQIQIHGNILFTILPVILSIWIAGTKLYIRRPAGAINVFKIVYRVISNACYVKRNSNIQ